MKIFLVRHSEAGETYHAPWQEDPDPSLTAEGRELASAMSNHLYESGEKPTAVYTSLLARTRQTGKIFAAKFGLGPVIQESGFGPAAHRGAALGVTLKTLAKQDDPKLKKILIVSHHDAIQQGLAPLNGISPTEIDIFCKCEIRIYDLDRKDGTWEEISRCLPSDVSRDFEDIY